MNRPTNPEGHKEAPAQTSGKEPSAEAATLSGGLEGRELNECFLTEEHGNVQLVLPVHPPLDHHDVDGVQDRPGQRPQRALRTHLKGQLHSRQTGSRCVRQYAVAAVTYGAFLVRVVHAGDAHEGDSSHAEGQREKQREATVETGTRRENAQFDLHPVRFRIRA